MGKNMSAAPKKKKPAKPAKEAILPVVLKSVKSCKGGAKGVSRAKLYVAIGEARPGTAVAAVRRCISKAIESEVLAYGATKQRFKLTDKARDMMKPKPKKK